MKLQAIISSAALAAALTLSGGAFAQNTQFMIDDVVIPDENLADFQEKCRALLAAANQSLTADDEDTPVDPTTTGAIAENQLTKIDVQVQNGAVTLSGSVASEEEKQTIQNQVAGMKGVQSVNNQLTVQPGSSAQNSTDSPLPRTPGNQ